MAGVLDRISLRTLYAIAALLTLTVAGIAVTGILSVAQLFGDQRRLEADARALVGKPDFAAVALLGKPREIIEVAAPTDAGDWFPRAYLDFRPAPTRVASRRVIIFVLLRSAIYVYVDAEGKVEAVEIGYT
jgi:hypothetical protein